MEKPSFGEIRKEEMTISGRKKVIFEKVEGVAPSKHIKSEPKKIIQESGEKIIHPSQGWVNIDKSAERSRAEMIGKEFREIKSQKRMPTRQDKLNELRRLDAKAKQERNWQGLDRVA